MIAERDTILRSQTWSFGHARRYSKRVLSSSLRRARCLARPTTEEVAWQPGDKAIAGVYPGIDEVLANVQLRRRHSVGTFDVMIEDIAAKGGWPKDLRDHGRLRLKAGQIGARGGLPQDQGEFDRVSAD